MNRVGANAPRWAWACVVGWLALVTVGPLLPGLLGRDDPAGDSLVAAVLLSSSAPALVLGAVLAYRRAWPVLAAAVAGALGVCPPAGLLLAGLVRVGDGPGALGAVLLAAGVALVFAVLPLALGASVGSTVRTVRPDGGDCSATHADPAVPWEPGHMADDQLMGDEVYQPDGSEVQDDIGPLEPEDTLDDRGLESALDEGYAPPERPLAVNRYGTTAAEQRAGESLDQRLAQELPDVSTPDGDGIGDTSGTDAEPVDPEAGETRTGRLTVIDGARSDTVARDVGISGGAATAEEAAMHTVDDPESQSH